MKTFEKKLKLNKKTIASLSSEDLTTFRGGSYTCQGTNAYSCLTDCGSQGCGTGPSGRPRPTATCPAG